MTEHPGPWTIDVDAGVHQINDANGAWVAECMAGGARLIAAAPDLLAALMEMLTDPPATLDEPDPDHEVIKKMRDIARAAIALATKPRP